jgi:aspartyl-tRNA(Asn)/glutamyl-tRNA(Gln) amidotransferase subunit C
MSRVVVSEETIRKIGRLARLSLSETETVSLSRDLQQVLDYADSLSSLALDDIPPMSHAGIAASLRDDAPRNDLSHEAALSNAPDASKGLFRVPRVIGG